MQAGGAGLGARGLWRHGACGLGRQGAWGRKFIAIAPAGPGPSHRLGAVSPRAWQPVWQLGGQGLQFGDILRPNTRTAELADTVGERAQVVDKALRSESLAV